MSTRLYEQYIRGDTSDRGDLQRRVWAATPWIVDVYTGRESLGERDRDFAIRQWLHDNFGDQSWPFGKEPRTGRWFRGGATINGWTWYGFDTEETMNAFLAAWPNPDDATIAAEQGRRSASAPADVVSGQGEKLP